MEGAPAGGEGGKGEAKGWARDDLGSHCLRFDVSHGLHAQHQHMILIQQLQR